MTTSRRKAADTRLVGIDLYPVEKTLGVDLRPVKDYLKSVFPSVDVRIKPQLLKGLGSAKLEPVAVAFAEARVKNPSVSIQSFEPMFGEIEFEKRALSGSARVGGIVYSGRRLEELFGKVLEDKQSIDRCSVVFTERLVSTFSADDLRHHLRTVVCGFPSIVSIPGMVEAPAKPREYHILKQQMEAAGAGGFQIEKLKSEFRGRFIDYDDSRMSEVLKGLALQAAMFHLTLDPFCENRDCRLFNAHWQEDLVHSQVKSGKMCNRHGKMISDLGSPPMISW